jgi:hypothetical protein
MIQYAVTSVVSRDASGYWMPAFAGHDGIAPYARFASNAIRNAKPASTVPISQRWALSHVGRVLEIR